MTDDEVRLDARIDGWVQGVGFRWWTRDQARRLGLSGTAMAVGVLTGARRDEAGMISGVSATGHEIGGTLGIAIYASIATAASGGIFVGPAAAAGIADAFQIASYAALGAGVAAVLLLPAAKTFLPKLRLNPQAIAAH